MRSIQESLGKTGALGSKLKTRFVEKSRQLTFFNKVGNRLQKSHTSIRSCFEI